MNVIPAIIADDAKQVSEKMVLVAPYVDWVQLDIVDGVFAPRRTWNDPAALKHIATNLSVEAHLMVNHPEQVIGAWIEAGVKRIMVHVHDNGDNESLSRMLQQASKKGVELGLALSPNVTLDQVADAVALAKTVLVLAVDPGFSGQAFQLSALEKIRGLRKQFPDVTIEVDGGINAETARQCHEAGADTVISASYIFDAHTIKEAIETLRQA